MSQEIIKLLMSIGNPIENFLFYDGLHNSFTTLKLSKNKNCPICGDKYRVKDAQALVFEGETVASFRNRVALAFGMANPSLMLKGKFLDDNDLMECKNGDKIYAIDERLAGPMSLRIKLTENE
jgi:hypothetical protein